MNNPKVSVIIPVYGVEIFIERCARSLFEQTLDDMEFVFVDDCTRDKSIEILKEVLEGYPDRKLQTKILHHDNNRGLPIARQTGLKAATGEYVIHCDSDDWVDDSLYEKLYEKGIKEKLEVVICDFKRTDGVNEKLVECSSIGNRHSCIDEMMHQKKSWSLCNKLYRRELYSNDILFPKDAMGEDMCLTLQLICNCASIGYLKGYYYYYYQNPNSIVQTVTEDKILEKYAQVRRNITLIRSYYKSMGVFNQYEKGFHYLEYSAKKTLLPLLGKTKYYEQWKSDYPHSEIEVVTDSKALFKERIKALLSIIGLYPIPRDRYQKSKS